MASSHDKSGAQAGLSAFGPQTIVNRHVDEWGGMSLPSSGVEGEGEIGGHNAFPKQEKEDLIRKLQVPQPAPRHADALESTGVSSPKEAIVPQSESPESNLTGQSRASSVRDEGSRPGTPKEGVDGKSDGAIANESEHPEQREGSRKDVEDDEAQDVMKIARDYVMDNLLPNVLLGLCVAAGSAPVFLAGLVHLTEGSILNVLLAGIVLGMTIMGVWSMVNQLRTAKWQTNAKHTALTALPDYESLKTIFSPKGVPEWITFPEYEKVEWLNKVMLKLWPHINQAMSALVKDQLQPVLDTYKMGSITSLHVHGFTLGNVPPRITGMKLMPRKGKLVLEAKVDWRSRPEQKLTLKIKTIGPDFKVQVKRLRTYGVLYMVFEPLIEEIPGFGALLFSLREEPEVDFDIEFLGGDVMALPGIDKMIDGIIRTALIDMLVWPSRLVFPAGPGDYRELQLHPVGQVYVILHEAKDLMDTDVIGKTDPFAFIYVRQKKNVMKRSTTKQNTLNPEWHEGFYIEVEDPDMQYLTVQIMDDEAVEKSEFVGAAKFALSQLKEGVVWDGWLDLKGDTKHTREGRTRGRVHLQIIYRGYSPEVIEEKLPKRPETGDIGEDSSQPKAGKEGPKSPSRLKTVAGKPFRFVKSLFHHDSKEAGGTAEGKESAGK